LVTTAAYCSTSGLHPVVEVEERRSCRCYCCVVDVFSVPHWS